MVGTTIAKDKIKDAISNHTMNDYMKGEACMIRSTSFPWA
jgi:hypothetical protein